MNSRLLALYGLKWNPFSAELPMEGICPLVNTEQFCWRIEHALVREGGFALICGAPGMGKSVAMRLLADRLHRVPDLTVGAMHHPQSHLADFYRELGDIFGISLKPSNRWGGFKALRERWLTHLETQRCRAVLLIDEAQEMASAVLSELRLLSSARFDSQALLCVVLAGDSRLPEKLRSEELIPLGSRIRTQLLLSAASRDELSACLTHLMRTAGNASLMTPGLCQTLCDHASGNYRLLTNMAAELLAAAAQRELPVIDEKLFLELYTLSPAWAIHAKPIHEPNPHDTINTQEINMYEQLNLWPETGNTPELSDEAAAQIACYLEKFISHFEFCYADQIERYFEKRCRCKNCEDGICHSCTNRPSRFRF